MGLLTDLFKQAEKVVSKLPEVLELESRKELARVRFETMYEVIYAFTNKVKNPYLLDFNTFIAETDEKDIKIHTSKALHKTFDDAKKMVESMADDERLNQTAIAIAERKCIFVTTGIDDEKCYVIDMDDNNYQIVRPKTKFNHPNIARENALAKLTEQEKKALGL